MSAEDVLSVVFHDAGRANPLDREPNWQLSAFGIGKRCPDGAIHYDPPLTVPPGNWTGLRIEHYDREAE